MEKNMKQSNDIVNGEDVVDVEEGKPNIETTFSSWN
jgi:hypothetical protein